MRRAFIKPVTFWQAAENPVNAAVIARRKGGERGGGRGGVGCLAVIDVQHAVVLGDTLHAVGKPAKRCHCGAPLPFAEPERFDNCHRHSGILQVVRALQRRPIRLHRRQPRAVCPVNEAPITPPAFAQRDSHGIAIIHAKYRMLIGALHGEQPCF